MINFGLGQFILAMDYLEHELGLARASDRDAVVLDARHSLIKNNVERGVMPAIATLHLDEARIASLKIEDMFNRYQYHKYTYGELANNLDRLRGDTLEGAKFQYFFHYPQELSGLSPGLTTVTFEGNINEHWQAIAAAFPSTEREIQYGLDCYAFGDLSGCVFHMMRLAEFGLRTIATELGVKTVGNNKPIEYGMWGEVFMAIEGKLKSVRTMPAGHERDEALQFYSGALSDLRFLQNYRDQTMHFREEYGKDEAYDAIHRTNALMKSLTSWLADNGRRL